MRLIIVPNALRDAIYERIDAAIVEHPDAASEREDYYQQVLAYYDEHGYVPEFSLRKREET